MVLLHHVTPCNDDVRELLKVFRTEVQEKMMLALFLDDDTLYDFELWECLGGKSKNNIIDKY